MGIYKVEVNRIVIESPDAGKKRIREAISRSKARVTFKHPGFKSGRYHQNESELEKKACILHDVDCSVLSFDEQAVRIIYQMDGTTREHFPDLHIKTNIASIFKEVKTDQAANDPFIKARTELLTAELPYYGYEYEVLVESEINKEPRLSNAKFLLRHGRKKVTLEEIERIRRWMTKQGGLTWGSVVSGVFGKYSVAAVCNLILRGYLSIDLNVNWVDETPILTSKPIIKE